MVQCNTCELEFSTVTDTQGMGCATRIYIHNNETYMHGQYGSYVHDMRLYRLKPDTTYKLGLICDHCASDLVRRGIATLIQDGVW